jgi:hypothetical protein
MFQAPHVESRQISRARQEGARLGRRDRYVPRLVQQVTWPGQRSLVVQHLATLEADSGQEALLSGQVGAKRVDSDRAEKVRYAGSGHD